MHFGKTRIIVMQQVLSLTKHEHIEHIKLQGQRQCQEALASLFLQKHVQLKKGLIGCITARQSRTIHWR